MEITIFASHRGTTHPLSLLPDSSLAYLQTRLEELTSVPPDNQKLLYKGKKSVSPDVSLLAAGLKDGAKVQVIGPTAEELVGLHAAETEHQRKDRILRERAQKGYAKVCRVHSCTAVTREVPPRRRRRPCLCSEPQGRTPRSVLLRPGPAKLRVQRQAAGRRKSSFKIGVPVTLRAR